MKASELKAGDWFETTTRRGKWRGLCVDPADECNETLAYLRGYSHVLQRLSEDEVTPLPDCTGWDWQPPAESYAARQAAWVEANGIKVGSRVRVVRVPENHEDGWDNNAFPRMHDLVDKEVTVTYCGQTSAGISVEMPHIDFPAPHIYFPYFVLEPVEPAPQPPLQVREGKWYRRRDGKIVGPTELSGYVNYRWGIKGKATYCDDGRADMAFESPHDLIAEVPPPSEEAKPLPPTYHMAKDFMGNWCVMETPDKAAVDAIDPGEGWRLLEPGEKVEAGDDFLLAGRWMPTYSWGWAIDQGMSYRRRITPEPEQKATYRAFRNAEEALPILGKPIRIKTGTHYVVIGAIADGGVYGLFGHSSFCKFTDLFEVYECLDGTPCGVREAGDAAE